MRKKEDNIGPISSVFNVWESSLIPTFSLPALFGESQGVQYMSFAFVSDITSSASEERTSRIALVEASLQASGVFASLLGGYLLQVMVTPLLLLSLDDN